MTQLSRRYVSLLREAHVMESQALQMLHRLSGQLQAGEALRARIDRHARQVAVRRDVLHRLVSRGGGWSRMIGLPTPANANGSPFPVLYTGDPADGELSVCHTFQHIKIATYLVLIDRADDAGDSEGLAIFEKGLAEECTMANWLRDCLDPADGTDAPHL